MSHYINGHWVQGQAAAFSSINPATGAGVWSGGAASDGQVDQAVVAAQAAAPSWAETPIAQRMDGVRQFAGELVRHQQAISETISRETGKPRWESLTEVTAMIGKVNLSIAAYQQRRSPTTQPFNGTTAATRFKPHGVCAVFGPFNLPGHLPNGHIVPALIAGNTVVFKPSEQTPATGEYQVKLWEAVGLPTGVINLVQGGPEVGVALSRHPGLDGLFFTGSSRVGLALAELFAKQPQKVLALEMGGNNPLIVWEAGDLIAAAYMTIQSAFITAGQRCTCARRLILPQGRFGDALLDQLCEMIRAIRVGAYTEDPEPFMGPVISPQMVERLLDTQQQLKKAGGVSIIEMTRAQDQPAMLSPGVIDVTGIADRPDEEWFGPLLQVIRVADFDAAIVEANHTRYGLSASLLSDSCALYDRFYKRIRAGVVNWNRPTTGASGKLPFGGVGFSGNHRPSGYYAADYCCYPVASLETSLRLPLKLAPGIRLTPCQTSSSDCDDRASVDVIASEASRRG